EPRDTGRHLENPGGVALGILAQVDQYRLPRGSNDKGCGPSFHVDPVDVERPRPRGAPARERQEKEAGSDYDSHDFLFPIHSDPHTAEQFGNRRSTPDSRGWMQPTSVSVGVHRRFQTTAFAVNHASRVKLNQFGAEVEPPGRGNECNKICVGLSGPFRRGDIFKWWTQSPLRFAHESSFLLRLIPPSSIMCQ